MSKFKIVCFSLLTILLFIFSIETLARFYWYAKYGNSNVLFYGFNKKEGGEGEHNIPAPDQVLSLRKHEIVKKTSTRIVVTGGSFVEGAVKDDESKFVSLLQSKANDSGIEAEFINAGFGGIALGEAAEAPSRKHLLGMLEGDSQRKALILPLNPDYIILFSGYNNMVFPTEPISWQVTKILADISWFFVLVREWIGLHFFNDIMALHYNNKRPLKVSAVRTEVKRYRSTLEKYYAVCLKNNIRLIVGTQVTFIPDTYKQFADLLNLEQVRTIEEKISKTGETTDYEAQYYQMAKFNFEMIDFAKDNNILLFDGISIYPYPRRKYSFDQAHLNEEGAKIQAGGLFKFLLDKKVINHKSLN